MQKMDSRRLRKLLALSLIVTLILSQSQVAKAKSEPGISSTEIRLGSSYPVTVAVGWHKDFFDGAGAYFKHLNANGGIYGRNIRTIILDDANIPTKAIVNTNNLILKDNVFALFNSSPTAATHIAANKAVGIDRRGVPDLAVTAPYSEFGNPGEYSTTFPIVPNARQEARVLLHFLDSDYKPIPFRLFFESTDLGVDLKAIRNVSPYKFSFDASYLDRPFIAEDYPTDSTGVFIFGNRYGVLEPNGKMRVKTTEFPLLVRGASISGFIPETELAKTFANHHLPAFSDASDPYIAIFREIFAQYASGRAITQAMVEGANAAYVVAQALAKVGKNPTRAKLIEFLRKDAKSLSTAAFSPLDYSESKKNGEFVQTIYTFEGKNWKRASDYFLVSNNGLEISKVTPQRLPPLPKGLPLLSEPGVSESTITCKKGKVTKEVSGMQPKCPVGYKKPK